jgi:hypothetical protein
LNLYSSHCQSVTALSFLFCTKPICVFRGESYSNQPNPCYKYIINSSQQIQNLGKRKSPALQKFIKPTNYKSLTLSTNSKNKASCWAKIHLTAKETSQPLDLPAQIVKEPS